MRGGVRIGSIWGVPLYADLGAFFLFGLFTWLYSAFYSGISPQLALPFGILTGLTLSFSILLHELAHTYVAKSQGIEVKQVALSLLGGFTEMDQEYRNPWSAFAVSLIGPLITLLVGLTMLVIANQLGLQIVIANLVGSSRTNAQLPAELIQSLGAVRILSALMCWEVGRLNLVWGIFNLLPFFPLDGGQVLRSILWKLSGDRLKSSIWAAQVGQVCGLAIIFFGIYVLFRAGTFDSIWLMLIGWMISTTAGARVQLTNIQQALLQLTCESAMTRDFRIVDGSLSLREFADRYLLSDPKDCLYFACLDGRDQGLIQVEQIKHIDRSLWEQETVLRIVKPTAELDTADLHQSLAEIINTLETKQIRSLTILSPVGSIAGVVDRGDVLAALARKLQWRIPESFLQEIKKQAKFPPEFRLAEISAQLVASQTKQE
jgi:Zn-dependent protease